MPMTPSQHSEELARLQFLTGIASVNLVQDSSTTTSAEEHTTRGLRLCDINHSTRTNRRANVLDGNLNVPSSPSDIDSTKSSPSIPSSDSPSAYASSVTSASTSSRSAKFSSSEEYIQPGKRSPHPSNYSPKSALRSNVHTTTMPSLFGQYTPFTAASAAIDDILREIVLCVKRFAAPSELDFYAGNPLALPNNEKNKSFIHQLRKLDALRIKLAMIPTHNDEELKKKHAAADKAIECALDRMKEHQLKLYKKFMRVTQSAAALDNLRIDLENRVSSFRYPSQLDFPPNADTHLSLLDTERNQRFYNQLLALDGIRKKLLVIRTYGDEQLEKRYKELNLNTAQSLQALREHQVKLYEKCKKASRSRSM